MLNQQKHIIILSLVCILHQLLLGIFAWRFSGLIGRTGDLIDNLIYGIGRFVYYFHDRFLSIEPQVIHVRSGS